MLAAPARGMRTPGVAEPGSPPAARSGPGFWRQQQQGNERATRSPTTPVLRVHQDPWQDLVSSRGGSPPHLHICSRSTQVSATLVTPSQTSICKQVRSSAPERAPRKARLSSMGTHWELAPGWNVPQGPGLWQLTRHQTILTVNGEEGPPQATWQLVPRRPPHNVEWFPWDQQGPPPLLWGLSGTV